MTFPKWRSYSYKPLEAWHKRRNSTGAIKNSRRSQNRALAHSPSPDRPACANNGLTTNGRPQPDAELSGSSVPTQQRNRSFRWTASLRKLSLRRRPNGSRQLRSSVSPPPEEDRDVGSKPQSIPEVPATEAELELLLQGAWGSILAAGEARPTGFIRRKQALEYSRKMVELRHQYKLRMAEILQREATFVQELLSHDECTPLLLADQLTIPVELQRVVHEVYSSGKFDKLRLELKRETATAILALKSRQPTVAVRQRQHVVKKPRPVSCPEWPSRTLVYCNTHTEVAQSGSMVGIFDGFYATENICDELHPLEDSSDAVNSTNLHDTHQTVY